MIRFENVSVTYDGAAGPTSGASTSTVPEGELVPPGRPVRRRQVDPARRGERPGAALHRRHLRGRVTVAGRDTRTHRPRELADVVGTVGQDPLSHFVTDTVEDELAYGMESLGVAPDTMRRRVEETLDLLGLAELRDRPIATLSGGQQQRVAIGSVLTPHPRVLVLDEPTSALDPAAAEEVLAVLQRLVHDLGTTVLHGRAPPRTRRPVRRPGRPAARPGRAPVARHARQDHGRLAGPPAGGGAGPAGRLVPAAADGARRPPPGGHLRERLAGPDEETGAPAGPGPLPSAPARPGRPAPLPACRCACALPRRRRSPPPTVTGGRREVARPYGAGGSRRCAGSISPSGPGETVALMGRNGAGKSTLLAALVGPGAPAAGSVAGRRRRPAPHPAARTGPPGGPGPAGAARPAVRRHGGRRVRRGRRGRGRGAGHLPGLVAELLPGVADDAHPRDLSEGQRLALALAVVLTARPPLLLLDEPTRGLDYAAKARLVGVLRGLAAEGHAIVLATHDVELAAELAHRVVILADGEVVADGPAADVVVASPAFAPQVAKILAPAAVADRRPGRARPCA